MNLKLVQFLAWAMTWCLPALASANTDCERIVSLAPSITELLFDVELGNSVVGVTRYCAYPPAAVHKPVIGGFLDPSLEVIASLHPDVVVVLHEQGDTAENLQKLGLTVIRVDHRSVAGILASYEIVGTRCRITERAARRAAFLKAEFDTVRNRVAPLPRVPALVSIGGSTDDGVLKNVFISGNDGYYTELLQLAGGENVYRGKTISFPGLSLEGLIALNPAVVLQIRSSVNSRLVPPDSVLNAWKRFPVFEAVRTGRVHILDADYASIPGPRCHLLLKDIARFLHPEKRDPRG